MQNLHRRFDQYNIGQIYGGDFAKFCGLLRTYDSNARRSKTLGVPVSIGGDNLLSPVGIGSNDMTETKNRKQ